MNTKLLVVGFVSLSLFAAAQSQTEKKKDAPKATHEVTSPRDSATGQATGRSSNTQPGDKAPVHRDIAAREASTGQASGKTMASDDWHQQKAASTDGTPQVKPVSATSTDANAKTSGYDVKKQTAARVAAGDVNGDGVDEATASPAAGSSDVKSPRDSSTGMATGKRQHQPVLITKESDKASDKTPKK